MRSLLEKPASAAKNTVSQTETLFGEASESPDEGRSCFTYASALTQSPV